MPRPCPSCCAPGQPPEPCEEPESITLRVTRFCSPFPPLEGIPIEILEAGTETVVASDATDEDGIVTIPTGGPGTFDVRITIGDCVELIEDVVVAECAQVDLGDQSFCCEDWCIYVYDGHDGTPISGASVSYSTGSGTTNAEGIYCFTPVHFGSFFFMDSSATGYHGKSSVRICLPCDCAEDVIPIALFPTDKYVFVRGWLSSGCPQPDECEAAVARPRSLARHPLFAEIAGSNPITGAGGVVQLDLSGDSTSNIPILEGWTTGGYGIKETQVYDGSAYVVTGTEQYDFPTARVRHYSNISTGLSYLEWANFVDEAGTIMAEQGYEFDGPRTFVLGHTYTRLIRVEYCGGTQSYPFRVRNHDVGRPGGTAADDTSLWDRGLSQHDYHPASTNGLCAPVDVAGTFWRGQGTCDDITIGYSLYE